MREIKFRAWDKNNNVSFINMSDLIFTDSWLTGCKDDFVIEQFTGLKDKNVYDNDICKIRVDFSNPDADKSRCETFNAFIFYDDDTFQWCWASLDGHTHCSFCEHEFEVLEIIGNIRQNPELMEATHVE